MKKLPLKFLVVLSALIGVSMTPAQTVSSIVVGNNILVSGDASARPHVEPCIAANPADPNHLVAASIAFTRRDAWFTVAVFTSFDGGLHWRRSNLEGLSDFIFVGDAWTAFGPKGVTYLSCIASAKSTASILVFRSNDGGRGWSNPVRIPFGGGGPFDRCSIVADTSTSKFAGYVYVLASQSLRTETGHSVTPVVVSRSTDGGKTFSNPVRILPNNLDGNVGNAAVLSDGTFVVTFFDYASNGRDKIRMLRQRRLWVAASMDGGLTFSTPRFVAEFADADPATHPRSGPNRMLAANQSSGTIRDRLYMVWTDFESGGTDIKVSYSTNEGETWSEPLTVNDSHADGIDNATPAIAVNKSGVVGVAWYDRRNDASNKCFEIFFTASLDGGLSFLPNARVSTVNSCPDAPGNVVRPEGGGEGFGVAARWPAGGDYSGLAASSDDLFHVLWSDSRTGVYQNWTSTVRVIGGRTAQSTATASVSLPVLRQELLERLDRDQAIRNEMIKRGVKNLDAAFIAQMTEIDSANTARMKEIVKQFGWPGPELVGVDGTEAAFLLVQHAEHAFQKQMLPLVEAAYRNKKLQGQDYALLLDRVLVADGKPQVYGTQTKIFDQWKGEEPVFEPIEDESNVDKRRAEVGLPSMAAYRLLLKQMYFPKDK